MITDDFEYADQAAFEAAWVKAGGGNILSDTTPLGTSKGLLTNTSNTYAVNAKDYGDPENGTVGIDIYDAGGADFLEFYVVNDDVGGLLGIGITASSNYQVRIIGNDKYGDGWFNTDALVARSIGKHTFAIEWAESGLGGFYIDGNKVQNFGDNTAGDFLSRGFDLIQLGHASANSGSPLVAHSIDNLSIIPEPATAVTLLLSGGLSLMLSICKRTRRR